MTGSITCEVGIRFGAVKSILTDISGMSKILVRWVPEMLINDQKRTQLDIFLWYLLSHYEGYPGDFIERVATQDETWVHQSQNCRANNGITLTHPLLRHLRGFIQQGS